MNEIKEIARKENAIFFKLELQNKIDEEKLKKFKFIRSNNVQPLQTIILDLNKTEEELLGQMHQKTRYNIKLAEKQVKVQISKFKFQNFDEFWKLMEKTSGRGEFKLYPKEHYKKMLEIPGVELFIAISENKIIAANIVIFYEKQAVYLHGASDYRYRNLMAPYLLQWEQIKEAKKRSCAEYDFWGINETKWPGVTRFKRGFCPKACKTSSGPSPEGCRGGQEITYPGAYDLVFKPFWYKLYKLVKRVL